MPYFPRLADLWIEGSLEYILKMYESGGKDDPRAKVFVREEEDAGDTYREKCRRERLEGHSYAKEGASSGLYSRSAVRSDSSQAQGMGPGVTGRAMTPLERRR